MNVTATRAPKSSVVLDIEVPAERLSRAIDEATRRLSRRNRIPGFRPGKAPRPILERLLGPTAVLDDAVDQLVETAYRDALIEQNLVPLTNGDVEVLEAEEGKPLRFKATVQVRPEVGLGDYRNFPFQPEIDPVDEPMVDRVIDELRDQNATLVPIEDRGAEDGDYAVIGFRGTRDGEPFDGGTADRMPLVLGEERLIPGFEANLRGLRVGESTAFDITFPDDYQEASLAGQQVHFEADIKELRAKVLPEADDDFAGLLGGFDDLAALRADVRQRLERNGVDRARHRFADRIIEYAVANATVELPDVLVEQEVEIIHDEFRATLARQGITYEAYLQVMAAGPKPADASGEGDVAAVETPEAIDQRLHREWRPDAERRVKTLMVISKIADVEGIDVDETAVEAELAKARERYAGERKLLAYFESDRGRNYVRSTLRRTQVVETLVDRWLAEHPDHPPLLHAEDAEPSPASQAQRATAAVGATDAGTVIAPAADAGAEPEAAKESHR